MCKPSDLLFTGTWMKDADDQLRATFDLGFAAGLEAAAKVCEGLAQEIVESAKAGGHSPTQVAAGGGCLGCAAAIRALPAAQRGDDKA